MARDPARDRQVRDGLFFIVGHHRGGTTLLQSMLSCHSRVTVPPETQFFLEVWPRRKRFGDLASEAGRRRLLEALLDADCAVNDLSLSREEILASLPAAPDCADVLVTLLRLWADARGKPRVGEKSPGHVYWVEELARLYPRSRFIACLRDPRAVVNSELRTEWGARSVHQIARRWGRVVDQHERLVRRLPRERYTMVQYEDLVIHPQETLEGVCAFLEEEFEPAMLRPEERPAAERGFAPGERWKHNTLKPLDPARKEAWRTELTPRQLEIIERTAGKRLARLGYAAAGIAPSGAVAYAWSRFADRVPWAIEVMTGAARRKRGPRRRRWARPA